MPEGFRALIPRFILLKYLTGIQKRNSKEGSRTEEREDGERGREGDGVRERNTKTKGEREERRREEKGAVDVSVGSLRTSLRSPEPV